LFTQKKRSSFLFETQTEGKKRRELKLNNENKKGRRGRIKTPKEEEKREI